MKIILPIIILIMSGCTTPLGVDKETVIQRASVERECIIQNASVEISKEKTKQIRYQWRIDSLKSIK